MSRLVLHRAASAPDAFRGEPGGLPFVTHWFEHDGEVFGVTNDEWGPGYPRTYEIIHGATLGTVAEGIDTLRILRRDAREECDLFLLDLRHEEEGETS